MGGRKIEKKIQGFCGGFGSSLPLLYTYQIPILLFFILFFFHYILMSSVIGNNFSD